jgi:hypothetical protein
MGRSGHVRAPDLPYGPRRELVELMHQLLAQSGLSGREGAKAADLAHSTFQKALSQRELPTLSTTMAIVLALAEAVSGDDDYLDEVDRKARKLWQRADEEIGGPDPVECAAQQVWADIMRGAGAMPDLPYQVHHALDQVGDWNVAHSHMGARRESPQHHDLHVRAGLGHRGGSQRPILDGHSKPPLEPRHGHARRCAPVRPRARR